ncbi:bifunctional [glutamate--ammonia ligase]-adenylyl-L-tyrosine phosphorylase/[glutamate--ammonia-ligase] adenylyltransferase [Dongshaea marina]|uniref:bifunctional [glutamate--ammonia ligase]-adenylyl-L-tyrosine phosphorylase/[glutamate--ammonia-ligase] adenylyltransferase n=1 Tax=Dongshaea marina TaxID=2047966 RepID=UPI001F189226|nr:bifunctional [glutamate--ammonia ligase]-adenylyl-L-tyrosine phosphorylase/[glutamate--ammonia-ligase] adenylyltransferase [Dongshaea marina]
MDRLPKELVCHADPYWQRLKSELETQELSQEQLSQLHQACAYSDFIASACIREPELAVVLLDSESCQRNYQGQLQTLLQSVGTEAELHRQLRRFRQQELARLAWFQLFGCLEIEDLLIRQSDLADALIQGARDWLYAKLTERWGTPVNDNSEQQSLLVIAMGKLGGRELNFSSDIDLILAFMEHGQTRGGERSCSNQEFFTKLGRQLVRALDEMTADGQVYRVDLRLRPFGDSGPLVASFAALEDYYLCHGRDWERYALIKARLIGSSALEHQELHQLLRPFVYRRYIDFSVIQALRSMKGMINAEIRRRDLRDNIKLGAGGIREVEFIAQSFQLMRGGREPALQTQSLLSALEQLSADKMLPDEQVCELRKHYLYLRQVENYLQLFNDKQTQTLPSESHERLRLCSLLGFATWQDCQQQIAGVMASVHGVFLQIAGEGDAQSESAAPFWFELWNSPFTPENCVEQLSQRISGPRLSSWPVLWMGS